MPCGPINSIREGVELAERLGLEPRVTVGDRRPRGRPRPQPDPPQRLRDRLPPPPPQLGEHSDEIREWLAAASGVSEPPTFRTGIGDSDADHILLLGHDLAGELIGQITFGELAYWLITKRRPTEQQRTMFEAVLVALADHGFTPTAIAARVTLLSAPESVQGALAAGLLGGGSRFLGVTEDTAGVPRRRRSRRSTPLPVDEAGWDAVAVRRRHGDEGGRTLRPGTRSSRAQAGRPAHARRCSHLARDNDCFGPHLELFAAIGRTHASVLGKTLPLNGAGVCGAVLADIECAAQRRSRRRPARPLRRPARPPRRGGRRSDRQRHLHERRSQHRLPAAIER